MGKKFAGPVTPGPRDLTESKIVERMSKIHLGDVVLFDSYKEAYNSTQVDRAAGATIKATGVVTEHHGGYVVVRLRRGLPEVVSYFQIEAVNGLKWIGYIKPESPLTGYKLVESAQEQSQWL